MSVNVTYTTERKISSAYLDSSVRLGISHAAKMIQDNVTECFGSFSCDGVTYKQKYNAFWVFTKAKFSFADFPAWKETVTTTSFPVDNGGLRTHINTVIKDKEGRAVITANQVACVLSFETHRPVKLDQVGFPSENLPQAVFTAPFERFAVDAAEYEFVYEQKVRYSLIDMSHHVNNTEYINLALDVFTEEYLLSHPIKELEVHYTGETKEGETLKVYKCTKDSLTYVQIKVEDRLVFECYFLF